MSFKGELKIGGKSYDVMSCSYAFRRDVDFKGRPSSGNYGGTVDITIESTSDTSILETMVNSPHKMISGSITWKKTDEDAKLKEITFENAYIIAYSEAFSQFGGDSMTYNITISAQTLSIGNAKHVNDWPKS
jgi:hypothetical protein